MSRPNRHPLRVGASVLAFAVAVLAVLAGCSTPNPKPAGASAAPQGATQVVLADTDAGTSGKGAAQLWTENCGRCHNVRSPDYYTPGRWTLVAQHMRVRGYLTGEEERQIAEFLRSQ